MRFFFYGTLLAGSENAVAREIHRLLAPLGPARVAGSLVAIPDPRGWYPALLSGEVEAHGWLYESRESFGSADLARLDAYEDYDPADPGGSLYIRRAVMLLGGGRAEAYFWNRPLPDGARPIPGGDFRRWLAERGLQAFGGLREG